MMTEGKKRIVNFRPLCVAAAYFAVGIACAYFAAYDLFKLYACAFAVVLFSFLFAFSSVNKKKSFVLLAAFSLIFCVGYGYSFLKIDAAKNATVAKNGERVEIFATVDRYSVTDDGTKRLVVREIEDVYGDWSLDGKAVCYVTSDLSIEAGDRVRLRCGMKNRVAEGESSSEVFCGVYYRLSSVKNLELAGSDATIFEKATSLVKKVLKSGMSEDGYSIAVALTLGDTSLTGESINAYRASGIAHAFAVSGLHVGLFVSVFAFIASKIKLKRFIKSVFVLLPTCFYCFVCGFRPSSVRALIMASVLILSDEIGFKRDRLSCVAVALTVVLCIQPFYLFDVGARLSFLAVTGIISLVPVLKRGSLPLKSAADPICTTVGASLATLPILVDMSGYMSLIAVFANLIFVPVLSFAYQFTVVLSVFGVIERLIFGSASVCLFLPDAMLSFIDAAVTFFDFESLTVGLNFGFAAFFYYFGLAFVTDYFDLSKKSKAIVSLTAFSLAVLFMILKLFG